VSNRFAQVAGSECGREALDVGFDDGRVNAKDRCASDGIRREQLAPEHVQRLAERPASTLFVALRPEQRHQPLAIQPTRSAHRGAVASRQYREKSQCLTLRRRTLYGDAVPFESQPTEGA
jgi:hypothetical protein